MNESSANYSCGASADDGPRGPEHPVSRIQTDVFCQRCGANLFDRPVWRTEQTDLLVASCRRCGKIASAAEALPYRRVWRQRLGATLMLVWMGMLIIAALILLTISYEIQDEAPVMNYMRPEVGGLCVHGPVRRTLDWRQTREQLAVMLPVAALIGLGGGIALSAATYHWPRAWHVAFATAFPLAALGLLCLGRLDSPSAFERLLPVSPVLLIVAATQSVAGVVGVLVGRPAVRTLIRVLLPNSGRTFFGFLWKRDGKELPMGRH